MFTSFTCTLKSKSLFGHKIKKEHEINMHNADTVLDKAPGQETFSTVYMYFYVYASIFILELCHSICLYISCTISAKLSDNWTIEQMHIHVKTTLE